MNSEPSLPLHTKIKEEDASNIIDLDLDKTPEDLVHEWESKVRVKFKECAIVESEHSLDILMKWYIKLIKEEAVNLEDFRTLKKFVMNHLLFLKLYFVELNCCFVDNYLDNMEEILSFYVNVEVKLLPAKQQSGNKRTYKRILSSLCHQIISVLNLYLLNREDRVCHVVMKVKLNLQSDESKDLLNILYGNFLTKRPKEKSDLEFCRAYILYQKWKTIRKPDDWEKMDEVMYNLHERTPDSIKSSPILKQILLPQNNSILDTLTHISEKHLIISEEYFKYIKSNKLQEDNIIVSGIDDIEIQDDDIISDLVGDAEDQEFEEAYKIHVRSMSSLYLENIRGSLETVNIKEENESDDEDCQIVAVSSLGKNRDDADMVHEILEDDDMEIIYMTKKDDKQNAPQEDKGKGSTLSFLESIKVSESRDVSMERVSSSTSNGYAPLPVTNSLVETSSKTEVVIADSPMSDSLGQKPSPEIPNVDTVTSAALTEPLQEATPVELELTERRDDTNHPSKAKTVTDVVAIDNVLESNPSPTVKKSVVSIETQTDEWPMDEANDKSSSSEKHADQSGICRNYYYYGLDTPPSDQLPDEQIPPVPESATYPKVYANIVRSHSPNEADSLTKATETDRLSPSVDDNYNDDNSKRSTDRTSNSVVQSEPCSSRSINENSPNFIEAEFIPNVAPNTRKKHKNLEKPPENKTNRLDSTDIETNTKKKRKKSKKPPENNEILIDTIFTPDVEPNTKKKHKKFSKPPESKQQLLNTLFTPGVESSAKKKHKNLNKPSENNPNLLETSFISDVEPNTKKKRKKFNKPPENNPNLLDAEFRPDIEPNTKKKRKKLNKTPENNSKHPYAAFTPNVEPETKKKRKNLHKQPENNPKRKKFNKTPGFDDPCSSRRSTSPRTRPNCEENTVCHNQAQHVSNNFQSNDSVPVGEGRGFPQTHTESQNVSSLSISTNAYHKTADTSSRANLRSPSPLKYKDSNIHETSTNVPCTSLDVVITSAESNSTVFNEQRKSTDISNASPDVTSTSMDVQDFGETLCNGEIHIEEAQLVYHHLSVDTTHNENYSSEEYVEYAECSGSGEFNNESVTQSNIVEDGEIYIEEPVLMTSGEEFTYFVHETLPVGANVNIYSEELSPNSHVVDADHESARTETEKHDQPAVSLKELKVSVEKISLSPHDRTDVSSVDEFSKFEERVQQWTKLRETQDLDEIFCGPVSKINETSSCVNPDANFDLFNSKSFNYAVQSTSEVTSPPYEAIEDFRTYFEESKNNGEDVPSTSSKAYADENIATTSAIIPDPPHSTDNSKATGLLIPRTLESLQDVGETLGSATPSDDSVLSPRSVERTKSQNTRRVHIDEETREFKDSVPQRPLKIHKIGVLRSILKKSCESLKVETVVPKSRISPEQMNLNSLEEYGIAPDDVLLQSIPCVSLSRLGENVIARWLRMSEIAFKLRQLRQKTHNGPGKTIKVEYDKQISPHINNKDMVQYSANGRKVKTPLPDTFGQWRTATVPQTQSDRLDEGLQELPYTEKKTGKRKGRDSLTMNTPTPKRGPGRPRKTF